MEVPATNTQSLTENLLTTETKRALLVSDQYAELEQVFLSRIQDAIEDDEVTPSQITSLVRSLKELRTIAPPPTLLPQQDTKPQIQIQFLNATQLVVE